MFLYIKFDVRFNELFNISLFEKFLKNKKKKKKMYHSLIFPQPLDTIHLDVNTYTDCHSFKLKF